MVSSLSGLARRSSETRQPDLLGVAEGPGAGDVPTNGRAPTRPLTPGGGMVTPVAPLPRPESAATKSSYGLELFLATRYPHPQHLGRVARTPPGALPAPTEKCCMARCAQVWGVSLSPHPTGH